VAFVACAAQDSTALFNKRVQKLKSFSTWLATEAQYEQPIEGIYYQYDSAQNKNWRTFDKANELYFNRETVDSILNIQTDHDVFAPAFRKRMIKGIISRYSILSHLVTADSLYFQPSKSHVSYPLPQKDQDRLRNTIVQYFKIDGEAIEYLSFTFEPEGTKLIGIVPYEPQGQVGAKLSTYLNRLHNRR